MSDTFQPDVVSSTLKRVNLPDTIDVDDAEWQPKQGDIVAVTVTREGGSYDQVERRGGEHIDLEEGMTILGVLCERKAVKGFVAEIPKTVAGGDELDFIGGGGVIARCTESLEKLGDAWGVRVDGALVDDEGRRLNVRDFALEWREDLEECPPLVMIAGTRMDSGKTTLAANLIEDLDQRGYRVGAAKLTGFTRQRDRVKLHEYGAAESMDFVDAGVITTMIDPDDVRQAGKGVLAEMNESDLDVIVVELGGGLLDPNHVMDVLTDPDIVEHTSTTVITALDPVAAFGAYKLLEDFDIRPDIFSGPSTDTKGGRDEITKKMPRIKALNGIKNAEEISEYVEERLEEDEE